MNLDNKQVKLIDPRDVEILEMVAGLTEQATRPINIPLGNVLALTNEVNSEEQLHEQYELLGRIGSAYTRIASALGLVASSGAQNSTEAEPVTVEYVVDEPNEEISESDSDTEPNSLPENLTEAADMTPIDKTSDYSDIDIPLILEDGFELLSVEAAVIRHILSNGPSRTEELRREVPEIIALTEEQYAEFKVSLKSIDYRISEYFKRIGLDSSWVEEGKARGKKYNISLKPSVNDIPVTETHSKIVTSIAEDTRIIPPNTVTEDDLQFEAPNDVKLSGREIQLLGSIISSVDLDNEFNRKAVNFQEIEFASDSARNQAFSNFTKKLIDAGYLTATGIKGGRKYQATEKLKSILHAKKINAEPDNAKTSEPTPNRKQTLSSGLTVSHPVISARERPARIKVKPEPQPTGLSALEVKKANEFADRVQAWVRRSVESTGSMDIKKSVLRKLISDEIGISGKEATAVITNLVATERLHKGVAIKGSAVVSLAKVEKSEVKPTDEINGSRKDFKTWNEQLVPLAERIMDFIDSERHLAAGKKTQDILRRFTDDDFNEMDVKIALRELCNQRLLMFRKDSRTSRSPHSKNLKIPKHSLKDKAARNRWRYERDATIQSLQSTAEVSIDAQ